MTLTVSTSLQNPDVGVAVRGAFIRVSVVMVGRDYRWASSLVTAVPCQQTQYNHKVLRWGAVRVSHSLTHSLEVGCNLVV
jgi:hypothetical protein